ncbi:gamma-aminobutyric acid type B receptor subunit 1-like [Ptychodera flava]|uniref:gamma-aminobutyric acid type B receptor subunit 1-like n=1 Tax=Ptychodera flava TaxID=63121 RepID=UPI00396A0063
MAIDDVNNSSDILRDYELAWEWKDDECNPGLASYLLYQHLFQGTQKIMVLGGGCSVSTVPIAACSWYFNMIQVSYSAASPELSDKTKYPLFFRTTQSENRYNAARITIMKYFNWTRVATVYGQHRMFVGVIADLIDRMRSQGIDLLTSLAIDYDPTEQLRIIKAYKLGMYGKNYAWMIPGWWTPDGWRQRDETINCTADEMGKVVESAIGTGQEIEDALSNVQTSNGETFDEYEERYKDLFETNDEYRNLDPHVEHGYGYDAIWAIALALNSSIDQVARKTAIDANGQIRQKRLDDFTYEDNETAQIFKRSFQNITFRGTTGLVSFNEHGDRIGKTAIYQIQGEMRVIQ